MRRSKRGTIEIQFNWIFVMIVGSILLLFFYSIVKVQQKSSDTEIGYTTAVDLNTIFTAALESTGTLNIIKIPETTIDFSCDEYWINDVNRPFNEKAVFSPNRLQSKRLMTWAVDWHAPYKVTNFLFITNPEIRYVIMRPSGGDSIADEFFNLLPEELNAELADEATPDQIQFKNDYKIRFVYFRDYGTYNPDPHDLEWPADFDSMVDDDMSAIAIAEDGLDGSGIVYFYNKEDDHYLTGPTGSFPYLRHETLLAAMFAQDDQIYACGIKKAFKKFDIVSRVYTGRTEAIAAAYVASSDLCRNYFTPGNAQAIQDEVKSIYDGDLYSEIAPPNIESLRGHIDALSVQNRRTIANSCARIF